MITVITLGDARVMLTGDAGRHALGHAADEYERVVGNFGDFPLRLSRRLTTGRAATSARPCSTDPRTPARPLGPERDHLRRRRLAEAPVAEGDQRPGPSRPDHLLLVEHAPAPRLEPAPALPPLREDGDDA